MSVLSASVNAFQMEEYAEIQVCPFSYSRKSSWHINFDMLAIVEEDVLVSRIYPI